MLRAKSGGTGAGVWYTFRAKSAPKVYEKLTKKYVVARLQAAGCQLKVDGVGEEEVVGTRRGPAEKRTRPRLLGSTLVA